MSDVIAWLCGLNLNQRVVYLQINSGRSCIEPATLLLSLITTTLLLIIELLVKPIHLLPFILDGMVMNR